MSYVEYARNWHYLSTVQTMINPALFAVRPFTFFTASGHYLTSLYVLWPVIFDEPAPPEFAGLCFGVLVGITIGFWIFVYKATDYAPLEERRKRPECDDTLRLTMNTFWFSDWSNHGPLLFMFSKYAYEAGPDAFSTANAWMPMAWGLTWFFGIWFPWQIIGGDPMYDDLRRDKTLGQKISVIIKMIAITTVGYFIGMYGNALFYENFLKVHALAEPHFTMVYSMVTGEL
jgi:hypothetical protein